MIKLWEALSSPANFPNYDARSDLGIGTLRARTHFNRMSQPTYPYIEEPSEDEIDRDEAQDEEEVDPVSQAKFRNALGMVRSSDPYAARSVDNQYYTPSASTPFHLSKLGEAVGSRSSRTNLVPNQDLYKNKEAVVGNGGWNAVQKPIQHTKGTKMGYSMASKLFDDEKILYSDEKSDDFSVVSNIRRIVNAYHDLNMLRK